MPRVFEVILQTFADPLCLLMLQAASSSANHWAVTPEPERRPASSHLTSQRQLFVEQHAGSPRHEGLQNAAAQVIGLLLASTLLTQHVSLHGWGCCICSYTHAFKHPSLH